MNIVVYWGYMFMLFFVTVVYDLTVLCCYLSLIFFRILDLGCFVCVCAQCNTCLLLIIL